jgi:hypothetical protein
MTVFMVKRGFLVTARATDCGCGCGCVNTSFLRLDHLDLEVLHVVRVELLISVNTVRSSFALLLRLLVDRVLELFLGTTVAAASEKIVKLPFLVLVRAALSLDLFVVDGSDELALVR